MTSINQEIVSVNSLTMEEIKTLFLDYRNSIGSVKVEYTDRALGIITEANGETTNFEPVGGLKVDTGGNNDWVVVPAADQPAFPLLFIQGIPGLPSTNPIFQGNNINAVSNFINTGKGDDIVIVGSGNDVINPGPGSDIISAGSGFDQLEIDNSDDTEDIIVRYRNTEAGIIKGGANDGTIFQNIERMSIVTGEGNDKIVLVATNPPSPFFTNRIEANGGDDLIVGSDGDDIIYTGSGNDLVRAKKGNDSINLAPGVKEIMGGRDYDQMLINQGHATEPIVIDYSDRRLGMIIGGENDGSTFRSIEAIIGSTGSGDDMVDLSSTMTTSSTGGPLPSFATGDGNDVVVGGQGNDILSGEAGDDTLIGNKGSDELWGGLGSDRLIGVDTRANRPGRNEIDYLAGGEGLDYFVLGEEESVFYTKDQDLGHATIADLRIESDIIQLSGDASQYNLETIGDSTWLYQTQRQDLIAKISGVTGMDLSQDYFAYV